MNGVYGEEIRIYMNGVYGEEIRGAGIPCMTSLPHDDKEKAKFFLLFLDEKKQKSHT